MRTLSLPAVAAWLLASAPAQGPIGFESRHYAPWPEGSGQPLQFERAVTGLLGEDALPDAVVVREAAGLTAAFYQPNVHRFNATYEVGTAARDAAILPNVAPGGRDGVLVLTAAGLELHRADAGQELLLVAVESAPAWQTASRVWVVESQAGTHTILGLDATGQLMLRTTWDGAAFASQAPFSCAPGVTDVQSLDYDNTGEHELLLWSDPFALITTWDGVFVYSVDTDISPGATPPAPYRRSAVVSRGDPGSANPMERDLVVLHVYWSTTGDYYVWAFNAHAASQMIPLNGVAANHQRAADVDGDGLQDVLLSRSTASEVVVLQRTAGAAPFSSTGAPNSAELVVPTGETEQGVEFSLAADLDGDGDIDILGFQSGLRRVHSFFRDVISGRRPRGHSDGSGAFPPGSINWVVERPADWNAIVNDGAAGALMVRIEGWVRPDSNSPFISARCIDETLPVDFVNATEVTFQVFYDPDHGGGVIDPADYVLQVHTSIVRSDGGVITKRYPSSMSYYTPNTAFAAVLEAEAYAEMGEDPPQDGDGDIDGNRAKPMVSPPP